MRIMYLILLVLLAPPVFAKDRLPSRDCAEIRQNVEVFLHLADEAFKTAEKMKAKGDSKGEEAANEDAFYLSEFAENYSEVYGTFCEK